MHVTLSTKHFHLSENTSAYLKKLIKKLVKKLPWEEPDYPLLDIVLRMHEKKSFHHAKKLHIEELTTQPESGHRIIDNPVYYDGIIKLPLPQRVLVVNLLGKTPSDAIKRGFDDLFRELDTYKGLHFVDDSEYYSKESIRKTPKAFQSPQKKSVSLADKFGKGKHRVSKYDILRDILVQEVIRPAGVHDKRVLQALRIVPRHLFVSAKYRNEAYIDVSLPTRAGQVVSQPSLVGLMVQALKLKGEEKVLEIGTGTGYMTAVLAFLAKKVVTIEMLPSLAKRARKTLNQLGINNVQVLIGNGMPGFAKEAPFDAIIVDAAIPHIPQAWTEQLKEGGRIVLPLGKDIFHQRLMSGVKRQGKIRLHKIKSVQITPLIERSRHPFEEVSAL